MTRPYIPMLAENNARRGFFEREQLDAMQRHLPEPIRPVAFRGAWQAACRAAGVPGRIFHDLRRTSVRNLERAGVPRSVAMKLTGHKTEAIYRRYAIVNDADLRAAAVKLAAIERPKPETGTVVPLTGTVRGR